MSEFTSAWLAGYTARMSQTSRTGRTGLTDGDAVERETDLQEQIEAELRRRGWPFVRTRMDRATTFTMPGIPDFVIAAPAGETLWLECKSRHGKQTTEQRGFQMLLERQKHRYALCRSFEEFLRLADGSAGAGSGDGNNN